jgi:hypothetical protein
MMFQFWHRTFIEGGDLDFGTEAQDAVARP